MFSDIVIDKIEESDLKVEEELGKGGFGIVKKMKLSTVCKYFELKFDFKANVYSIMICTIIILLNDYGILLITQD